MYTSFISLYCSLITNAILFPILEKIHVDTETSITLIVIFFLMVFTLIFYIFITYIENDNYKIQNFEKKEMLKTKEDLKIIQNELTDDKQNKKNKTKEKQNKEKSDKHGLLNEILNIIQKPDIVKRKLDIYNEFASTTINENGYYIKSLDEQEKIYKNIELEGKKIKKEFFESMQQKDTIKIINYSHDIKNILDEMQGKDNSFYYSDEKNEYVSTIHENTNIRVYEQIVKEDSEKKEGSNIYLLSTQLITDFPKELHNYLNIKADSPSGNYIYLKLKDEAGIIDTDTVEVTNINIEL